MLYQPIAKRRVEMLDNPNFSRSAAATLRNFVSLNFLNRSGEVRRDALCSNLTLWKKRVIIDMTCRDKSDPRHNLMFVGTEYFILFYLFVYLGVGCLFCSYIYMILS